MANDSGGERSEPHQHVPVPIKTELLVKVAWTTVTALVSVMVYIFTTFATMTYVDGKVETESNKIARIEKVVDRIDERTWQLAGKKGPPPIGKKE